MTAATPGQAAGIDPATIGYRVQAHAFNALSKALAYEGRFVALGEREAVADAVVAAIEPLIRADERAIAAEQPQPAPELAQVQADLREAQHAASTRGEVIADILARFGRHRCDDPACEITVTIPTPRFTEWRERAGLES